MKYFQTTGRKLQKRKLWIRGPLLIWLDGRQGWASGACGVQITQARLSNPPSVCSTFREYSGWEWILAQTFGLLHLAILAGLSPGKPNCGVPSLLKVARQKRPVGLSPGQLHTFMYVLLSRKTIAVPFCLKGTPLPDTQRHLCWQAAAIKSSSIMAEQAKTRKKKKGLMNQMLISLTNFTGIWLVECVTESKFAW